MVIDTNSTIAAYHTRPHKGEECCRSCENPLAATEAEHQVRRAKKRAARNPGPIRHPCSAV